MFVDEKCSKITNGTPKLSSRYHNYLERKEYVITRPTSKYFSSLLFSISDNTFTNR